MALEQVLLIVLGWFLGILSGPITEAIRRARRRRELTEALKGELMELRQLMAALTFRICAHLGRIDHDLLGWVLLVHEDDVATDPELTVSVAGLQRLKSMSTTELASAGAMLRQEGVSLQLKTYSLPLMESAFPELCLLDPKARREMLGIRGQLDLLNQDVPRLMALHEQTFDEGMAPPNRAIVMQNLQRGYETIERRARDIAHRIGRLYGVPDAGGAGSGAAAGVHEL